METLSKAPTFTDIASDYSRFLPTGFETTARAEKDRGRLEIAIEKQFAKTLDTDVTLPSCTTDKPCNSRLCALCTRAMRLAAAKLVFDEGLYEDRWYQATLRPHFSLSPGDHACFDETGHKAAANRLLQRLRRFHQTLVSRDPLTPPLRVIGSFEVGYKTIANVPQRKSLHWHFLISGVSATAIKQLAQLCIYPAKGVRNPYDVRPVDQHPRGFLRALTYCMAQPFHKDSYSHADAHPRPQELKLPELYELASNYGGGNCASRLSLVGFRYERDQFRFSTLKSGSR